MKKVIAVILTCILILPIAVMPAFASTVIKVEIPSDVAGVREKYFEGHVGANEAISTIMAGAYTDSFDGDIIPDTLKAGNVYYVTIWFMPAEGYEIPKCPNLFNVRLKTGKGVFVTRMTNEDGSLCIRAKILVDGGSFGERIENVFQSFFGRIAFIFNKMIRQIKSIGK